MIGLGFGLGLWIPCRLTLILTQTLTRTDSETTGRDVQVSSQHHCQHAAYQAILELAEIARFNYLPYHELVLVCELFAQLSSQSQTNTFY